VKAVQPSLVSRVTWWIQKGWCRWSRCLESVLGDGCWFEWHLSWRNNSFVFSVLFFLRHLTQADLE